jgi:hypothetical protein
VLDTVLSSCDPGVAKAYTAWEAYDRVSAAWSACLGDDATGIQTRAQALRAAAEDEFSAFFVVSRVDVTPYIHFVVCYFPT